MKATEIIPTAMAFKILIYTHNSIGLGHAVRTMALIDGMRKASPDIEWLVLSGTSIPQIFLDQGVEIVKLPSIRHALEFPGEPFLPRRLKSLKIEEIIAWRRRLIGECLLHFKPDVIMIEHTLAGLEGEASPLLGSRAACGPGKGGPVLVHLSRGIHRLIPERLNPPSHYPNLAPGTNILHLYDAFFVFEEKAVVDVNREFWGADPFVENKIHYLGRVAARNADELGSPVEFPAGFRTKDRPFVLLSLGRFGNIEALHFNLFKILRKVCRHRDVELRVVADVYLKPEILKSLKNHGDSQGVRFLPFIPYLVQVMSRADLVICRAGYNMINEVLLSGVKALIIPENHPSREQERRAAGLSGKGLLVRDEDYCLSEKIEEDLKWLMKEPPRPPFGDYDRFRIGRIMIEELQRLLPSKQVRCS